MAEQRHINDLTSVGRAAQRASDLFESRTHLRVANPGAVERIDPARITVGKLLGNGSFCDVYELKSQNVISGEGQLVIKRLKQEVIDRKPFKTFLTAAIDLVSEAHLLASLDHENIVQLRAVSGECLSKAYLDGGYHSLILERIHDTVEDRLELWRKGHGKPRILSSLLSGRRAAIAAAERAGAMHRLKQIALPVAEALHYLHSQNVVFRDLKPANVGFDASETVKIYDFGLAREIVEPERRLTAATGSRRYMAPEVALGRPYGLPADVYSFGILLWELTTLGTPFDAMTHETHFKQVVEGGARPEFPKDSCSDDLKAIIEITWGRDPATRPNFKQMSISLGVEVDKEDKAPPGRLYETKEGRKGQAPRKGGRARAA